MIYNSLKNVGLFYWKILKEMNNNNIIKSMVSSYSKYQNAKIYKIINDIDDQIYVGSTITSLNRRFSLHKCNAKVHPNIKLYKHFAKLGVEHFKIILIKLFPCNNKIELAIEEERTKIRLNAQLNMVRAHRTVEQKKEYDKEWKDRNYKNNRDKILLQTTEYREKNRAKINERLFCKICGKTYTRSCKSHHCRTKRHQKCVHFNESKISTDEKYEKLIKNKTGLKL
jgi:hypothetical protein